MEYANDGKRDPAQVTRLLHDVSDGETGAYDRLFALVYDELKQIARRQLRREREGHTLHATALVHEAYIKLGDPAALAWRDRAHFYGVAARAMRQVLVDHARRRNAAKRGGDAVQTTLGEGHLAMDLRSDELLALDDALERLDPRQRHLIELRFFAGLTEQQAAEMLGVSERTVRRDWTRARAWLYSELYPETA